MLGRAGKGAAVLVLVALAVSCASIPETPEPGKGEIVVVDLPYADAIPAEWGDLVSTGLSPDMRYTWLWFQDAEGTVRLVTYNQRFERFTPKVRVFHRR